MSEEVWTFLFLIIVFGKPRHFFIKIVYKGTLYRDSSEYFHEFGTGTIFGRISNEK